jgi:TetR/AcrR family transcriptional regulator, cholesterol catabolism regulator
MSGRSKLILFLRVIICQMVTSDLHRTRDIPTQIKNPELVERRRRQIADAAVRLFIVNGYDKTTTRQIAGAARLSIGSLYEYFATKEDVLYLVMDSIYREIEQALASASSKGHKGRAALKELIRQYFLACHRKSDYMLLLYQETHVLTRVWRKRVMKNELGITAIFEKVVRAVFEERCSIKPNAGRIQLTAHNISVLAHMWTFRRWALARNWDIEEYIDSQTGFIMAYIDKQLDDVTNEQEESAED